MSSKIGPAGIKRALEKKIDSYVETLGCVRSANESDFLAACRILSRTQYLDTVEERGAYDLCGYPLCGKQVRAPPGAYDRLYRLSAMHSFKSRDRINFCSHDCYFGSNFVAVQLREQPVWETLSRPPTVVKLFHAITADERIRYKLSSAFTTDGRRLSERDVGEIIASGILRPKPETAREAPLPPEVPPMVPSTSSDEPDESSSDDSDEEFPTFADPPPPTTTTTACDAVDEDDDDDDDDETPKVPTRFERILKYAKEWSVNLAHPHHRSSAKKTDKSSQMANLEEKVSILSIVDCSNVQVFRRTIVKDKLKKALVSLVGRLGKDLATSSAQRLTGELVKYLDFSNTNVILDADEWKIVALVLLKAFSTIDDSIQRVVTGDDFASVVNDSYTTMEEVQEMTTIFTSSDAFIQLKED